MENKLIVIYGNPVEGFAFVGPFDTREDAIAYAEADAPSGWFISDLWMPDLENIIGA